jgi:chromosomal replication initiator protein
MDNETLWQAVLGEIELNLSRANFTTWFKCTFISKIENQQMVVCVPNAFTKSWLENKYNKLILSALQRIASQEVKNVVYQIETRKGGNSTVNVDSIKAPVSKQFFEAVPNNRFGLNSKYTFDSFIVGKGNELAHAACQAIVSNPGRAYNPLFIYGGVGLGKTHLIQAVGHELSKATNKILYVSCEKFTNDYVMAVRSGRAKEFKDLYRGVDLLLVDDIQFMGGKDGTQEEFFHTFNELHQTNKQIVITSDRQPKQIPALENRLLSRFEWGMIADVSQPDFETRVAILETKCKEKNYIIETEILHYIANNIESNIRELEGVLNRVIAYHEFNNTKPTTESTKQVLGNIIINYTKPTSSKQIIDTVSSFYNISIGDIIGKSRKKELVKPRQIIMFLLREEMGASYPSIGEELGGRDHTTAMHAYNKILKEAKEDTRIKQEIENIKLQIKNNISNKN